MAGDWIKMQVSTPDKPEVWHIADLLDIEPDAVFGKLFRVWVWFDQNTEKGNAPSVSKKLLDRLVFASGFCDAVIAAGWMTEADGVVSLPNFDRHNGKTAKKRALTAKRVTEKKRRDNAMANAGSNARSVSCALPREDKREDIEPKGSLTNTAKPRFSRARFESWYQYFPNKKNRGQAEKAFKTLAPDDELIALMVQAIDAQTAWRERLLKVGAFVPDWPHPASWLRGQRWLDELDSPDSGDWQEYANAERLTPEPTENVDAFKQRVLAHRRDNHAH